MLLLAYRLVAHGIGGRTVRELRDGPHANDAGMDYDEFLTWAAYTSMFPFPEDRADLHAGMLMAQQYNMHRGKNSPARKASDFIPRYYTPEPSAADDRQARAAMEAWYLHMGGDPSVLS